MTEEEVVQLMESSQSHDEWNENADKVKAAHDGGYPSFWFKAIVMSGLAQKVAPRWGGSGKIEIRPL